jgi:hypothetical protein
MGTAPHTHVPTVNKKLHSDKVYAVSGIRLKRSGKKLTRCILSVVQRLRKRGGGGTDKVYTVSGTAPQKKRRER